MNDSSYQDDATSTVAQDLLFNLILAVLLMLVIVLPFINPIGKEATKSPGELVFELTWPVESKTDFDLWVKSPDDDPVFYARKRGNSLDLLRDDLGDTADISPTNAEFIYARAMPEGRYVVNVNQYRKNAIIYPGPEVVFIRITHRPDGARNFNTIYQGKKTFQPEDKEQHIVQFDFQKGKKLGFSSMIVGQSVKLRKLAYDGAAPEDTNDSN